MIVLGLLSIILAAISPIFGLIFIIPLAGKRILKNPAEAYVLLSTMTVVIIGMLLLKYIDILGAYSMLFGFAFESVLFLYLLTKSNDFEKSICITGAYGLIVISLREFLMNQQYVLQINAVASQINKILENEKSLSQIQLTASKEIVLNMKQILIDYQIAIWIIVTAIGLYLGTLLYYRVTRRSYDFATIRLPFAIIYFLILSLALYLWKGYKIIGANLILSCGVFFLIQGMSVLYYYIGDILRKSKTLLIMSLLTIVVNNIITIIIASIGLLDFWFDFRRRINKEDFNESNTK